MGYIVNLLSWCNGYETDNDGQIISTAEAQHAFAEESGEVSQNK